MEDRMLGEHRPFKRCAKQDIPLRRNGQGRREGTGEKGVSENNGGECVKEKREVTVEERSGGTRPRKDPSDLTWRLRWPQRPSLCRSLAVGTEHTGWGWPELTWTE